MIVNKNLEPIQTLLPPTPEIPFNTLFCNPKTAALTVVAEKLAFTVHQCVIIGVAGLA